MARRPLTPVPVRSIKSNMLATKSFIYVHMYRASFHATAKMPIAAATAQYMASTRVVVLDHGVSGAGGPLDGRATCHPSMRDGVFVTTVTFVAFRVAVAGSWQYTPTEMAWSIGTTTSCRETREPFPPVRCIDSCGDLQE